VNADGSGRVNLSSNPFRDWFPTWSPDGTQIAFASLRDGNAEIYVVNADGSRLTNLTQHGGQDFCPAWSPDGRWIAFVSRRDGNREIYVMRADGSAQTRLTDGPSDDYAPIWQSYSEGRPTAQGSPYGLAMCSGGIPP
jgi:TolB protein